MARSLSSYTATRLGRRSMLEALTATVGACLLPAGCGGGDDSGPSAPTGGTDPILTGLRRALAASPDYLRGRADEAVKTGDAAQIVGFVRDHVSVFAPLAREIPTIDVRVGARGALRAGAGSFRDRAELMVELLTAAGFTATVVEADLPVPTDDLYAWTPPSFAPDRALLQQLGRDAGVAIPNVFAADTDAATRVDDAVVSILAALPPAAQTALVTVGEAPSSVPIVEFAKAGQAKRWAIALGAMDVVDAAPAGLRSASPANGRPVEISVSVALLPPAGSTLARDTLHEVMSASFQIDDVVGRNVSLVFPPPVDPALVLGYDISDAPIRTPVLRLHSLDPLDASVRTDFGGAAITLSGGIYGPSPDDPSQIVGPYGPVLSALDRAGSAAARAKVAAITADASTVAFPEVELAVSLLDADGAVVPGLGAEDLVVQEGGVPVKASVIANAPPATVRVLVLYDSSGSVTDTWPSASAKSGFETALANALVGAAADAPFVVQVVGLGGSLASEWVAPNAVDIAARLGSTTSTSDVWGSVGDTLPKSAATAAILVSDCASSLEDPARIPGFQRALAAAGIPVAVVPIGTPDTAALATIVSSSRGTEFDALAPDVEASLREFVKKQVATRLSTAYRLRYTAPTVGPAERSVQVQVSDRATPVGRTSYQVPAPADRVAPSGICGIYLSITTGGVTDLRRLGGVELGSTGVLRRDATAADVLECTRILNGVTDMVFDAYGATNAQRLDDAVVSLLSYGKLMQAPLDDKSAILAAARDARRIPWFNAALGESFAEATDVTPVGLSVHVTTTLVVDDTLQTRSDVPPALGGVVGTSPDPGAAWQAALRASAVASVRESQFLSSSAAASLAGEELVLVTSTAGLDTWPEATKAAFEPLLSRYEFYHRLVPKSGKVVALWVVDKASGSATAVSADARGGGSSGCTFDPAPKDLVGALGLALMLLGVFCISETVSSSVALFGWYCTRAKVFGTAVATVGSFSSPVSYARGVLLAIVTPNFGDTTGGRALAFVLSLMLYAQKSLKC